MGTRTNERSAAGEQPDLRQFTFDFFTAHGARVTKLDRRRHGALRVTLSEELAAHFARDEMILCFQHVDLGGNHELVAYGSRVFDGMMSFLDQSGALTVQQLPQRFRAGEELLQAVRPANAAVAGLHTAAGSRSLYIFNWHITYRADDKREELYTVVVDEAGDRIPLVAESKPEQPGFDLEAALQAAAHGGVSESTAAASSAAARPATSAESRAGEEADAKLPPMTQIVRAAEAARKYAIYHADLRCVAHEAEILPRLHKVLSRLITYYQQQIDEVYDAHDPNFDQRRTLEADLRRKVDEEVENHRLRVTITLSSYAILVAPVATATLTLHAGDQRTALQVERDLYSGEITRPPCHACGEPVHAVTIDKHGHLTCAACLHQCATCGDYLCAECGVYPCPVCRQENEEACSTYCWACGERSCRDHADRCPVCDDTVCLACQSACAACGTRQCTSHLCRDAVADAHGATALICSICAVRCPGCRQYSAQMVTCSSSGQRFCQNCTVHCTSCGRAVGPGFYHADPQLAGAVCSECLLRCPACHAVVSTVTACTACATPCCAGCGTTCATCGELYCQVHLQIMEPCGHALCARDVERCAVGGEALCPACQPACAICGAPHCADHAVTCHLCRLEYCSRCVADTGRCASCAQLDQDGQVVELRDEPCIDDPAVADVAPHYKWRRIANRRYLIYLGKGLFMAAAVVTVEKTPTGGRVVAVRELELGDLLRVKFWRD